LIGGEQWPVLFDLNRREVIADLRVDSNEAR
jgi:hypothetical protein